MPSKLYSAAKKAALSVLYRLPPFPQNIHGSLVWIHPRARFSITTQTFFRRESHVRTWLTQQLERGDVFFDVGAHHGWVSLWTLPLVGQQGFVYSFEPSPANLAILEWHRKRNNFPHWVIVPKAVSDTDAAEEEFFLIDAGDSPMNSLITRIPGTPLMSGREVWKTSIQTITLDAFCAEISLSPDLVKIDVEGAELMVLRGAAELVGGSRPAIILAVHPYWLPAGQSPQRIFEFLTRYGYRVFNSEGRLAAYLQEGEYLCLGNRAAPDVVREDFLMRRAGGHQ